MKRIFSLLAALLMVITVAPAEMLYVNAAELESIGTALRETASELSEGDVEEANTDDFNAQLSELLSEYAVNDCYSKIVIDVENNTIQKDGEEPRSLTEYGIDYSCIESTEPVIAAEPFLEMAGIEAETDSQTGEISVVTDSGEEINLDADTDEARNDGAVFFTAEQAEEIFLETEYEDGKITVTEPYQTKRIVLQTKNKRELNDDYSAVRSITDGEGYYVLQFETEEETVNALQALEKDRSVEYAVCDQIVSVLAIESREGAEVIQSDRYRKYLAENGKNGRVTVAVLDTGIDVKHSFLSPRMLKGYNAYDNSTDVSDVHGHGTHVAGIVTDNTNENVKIMPVKVMDNDGYGTQLAIKTGIEYAVKNGADVINMSLGGGCGGEDCLLCTAVVKAVKSGVTVVAGAGNDTQDTEYFCPAKNKECITVASATEEFKSVSTFSNFGEAVDLCAPGENILSCSPGGGYVAKSGTSMATPFIAAAAAMLLTDNSGLTPAQVESTLTSYCSDMLIRGWDKYSGHGLINFGIFFGDSVKPSKTVAPTEIKELLYFSKTTPYYVQVGVYPENDGDVLTDRSFTVTSSDSGVAVFDGKYIWPKGAGECVITVTLANGAQSTINVKVRKKEVWTDYAATSFAGGKGTEKSPYLISTPQQLAKLANDIRADERYYEGCHFKLKNDIDLSGKYWISIGGAYKLTGSNFWLPYAPYGIVFDGNNHKIKNMTLFDEGVVSAWGDSSPINQEWFMGKGGLFTELEGCTVKNLGIENAVNYNRFGGLLAGYVYENSYISNCYTTGMSLANGLFERISNFNVVVKNCYSSATVLENGICAGITSSIDEGNGVKIHNVFFCGEHLGSDRSATNSGFSSSVEASEKDVRTNIYNCFSAGVAESGNGFLTVKYEGNIYSCYYNGNNACSIEKDYSPDSTELKGVDASFFKVKKNFTDKNNWHKDYPWDFENVWAIDADVNNGYPYLKNMKPEVYSSDGGEYWYSYASDSYAGGEGTKEKPYLIETAEQFARLAKMYRFGGGRNKYFKLMKDIDLSAHEWYPIGGAEFDDLNEYYFTRSVFFGNIDGNGKTITGLKISSYNEANALIAGLEEGSVKNLRVKDAVINSGDYGAILVGYNRIRGLIYNCEVTGTVTVQSDDVWLSCAGLICGNSLSTSRIVSCRAGGTVNGAVYCSGISGKNGGLIEGCYVDSSFSTDCAQASGIAAYLQGSVIKNCYSIGLPLMCSIRGEIVSSYQVASKCMVYHDTYMPSGSVKLTEAKMKLKENYSGFDFESIWSVDEAVNGGYPYLNGIPEPETVVLPDEKWVDYAATSYAGGNGTEKSPYLIATAEQLALMNKNSFADGTYFKLIRDIDLGGKLWDSGYSAGSYGFNAFLDGNGKTVSNVTVKNGGGLFSYSLSGSIVNLNVENFIGNCAAGLVCSNSGYIKNCHVKGNLTAATDYYGSLLTSDVGGICENNYGTIEQCSFEGTLSGSENVNGIAGWGQGDIINCYVKGDLGGGGSFSAANSNFQEEKCFSVVKSERTETTVNNKYGVYKLTSAAPDKSAFKKASTFELLDFENIWSIDEAVNDGYPYLKKSVSRKLSYVLNGGNNPQYVQTDYIPGNICGLPVPTKKDYVFAGWYRDAGLTVPATDVGAEDEGDIVLYAKWGLGYTVVYDSNGGKGKMNSQSIPVDVKTALSKNTFTRNNHDFMGWSTEKNGKVVYKDCQEVSNISAANTVITLYAVWKPYSYTIRFDPNGGKGTMADQTVGADETVTLRKNTFTKDKSIFMGWSTMKDGIVELPDEAICSYLTGKDQIIVLYAIWNDDTYTLKFNANGGKGSMSDILMGYDVLSQLPLNKFTKSGYFFAGWATKPDGQVRYVDGVEFINLADKGETLTLYAVWEKDIVAQYDYVVKFNANGGKGTMKSQKFPAHEWQCLSENKFTRKGYVFSGWSFYKDGDAEYKNKQEVQNIVREGTVTLYAVWREINYTVKFNANGGSGKMSKMKKASYFGETLIQNKFKAPKGKVFSGWALSKNGKAVYEDGALVEALTEKDGSTVTLYAVWIKKKTYKITYKVNKGKKLKNPAKSYVSGVSDFELPVTTRKGYTFLGWCTDKKLKSTPIKQLNTTLTGDLTLYAKWQRNSYSVKYNANGGSGKMKKQTGFKYGKTKALSKCTFTAPKGKVFAGWATSKNGKAVYTNKEKVKNLTSKNGKTVTLYAVWVKPKKYSIKYYTNGGTLSKDAPKKYKSGSGCTLAEPVRKGYKFVGWYTDKKLKKGKISLIKPWQTGTVKVYAKWKKA